MTKLFLYGTLMKDFRMLRRIGVQHALRYIGRAKMRGRMYKVDNYPAAIQSETTNGFIHGELYEVLHQKEVFQKLDGFEEIHPQNHRLSLYNRKRVRVTTDKGKVVLAWAYLYNQPLKNATLIRSGDYKKHVLRAKGNRPQYSVRPS